MTALNMSWGTIGVTTSAVTKYSNPIDITRLRNLSENLVFFSEFFGDTGVSVAGSTIQIWWEGHYYKATSSVSWYYNSADKLVIAGSTVYSSESNGIGYTEFSPILPWVRFGVKTEAASATTNTAGVTWAIAGV